MEHACYKCGAKVEDGVPFCPHCGAPQIRVVGVADQPATPPLAPGTPGEAQPPAQPVILMPPRAAAAGIEWRQALPGAILAAVLVALFSSLAPILGLICALLAGGMAVRLYMRRTQRAVSRGEGARLGALTGAIAFLPFAAVTVVGVILEGPAKLRQRFLDAAARNPSPDVQQVAHWISSPEGLAAMVTIALVMCLIVFVILSTAGGALAASLWGRDR